MSTVDPGKDDIDVAVRYSGSMVYRRCAALTGSSQDAQADLDQLLQALPDSGVIVRGLYDVSSISAEADLMIWWHAGSAEALQSAARRLRRTAIGRTQSISWAAMGLLRPAEFNKDHLPAFLTSTAPRNWVTVFPFNRLLTAMPFS